MARELLIKDGRLVSDLDADGFNIKNLPGGGTQVQTDWEETDQTSLAFIQNKPSLGSLAGKSEVAETDLASALANKVNSKYTKPAAGIPATDLAMGVIPTVPTASTATPLADGTASAGSSAAYARGDHRHPTDTSRQAKITASGILQGDGNGGVSAATIDATPMASSVNPVQSGGVKTALDGKVSGALGSGGWRVTNGQRDYVFASDTMADDESTIARIGDLRYPKHTLTTPAGSATLLDRACNKYVGDSTFTSCTFTLPPAIDGQVRDFLLDVDNSANASDVAAEFYGLGTDYALAVNADEVTSSKTAGEVLAEMTVVEAGTRARLYFTEANQTLPATVGNESIDLPILTVQRMTIAPTTVHGGA